MTIDDASMAAALLEIGRKRLDSDRDMLDRFRKLEGSTICRRALLTVSAKETVRNAAVDLADRWIADERTGIAILSGQKGTGKTVAAARWAMKAGAHWVAAWQLGLADYKALPDMMGRLSSVPALVIDELGGLGSVDERQRIPIAALLVQRHASMLPTICTTNMSRSEFAGVYDGKGSGGGSGRILERIEEDGEWLACEWASYRSKPAATNVRVVADAKRRVQLAELADTVSRGYDPGLGEDEDGRPKTARPHLETFAALLGADDHMVRVVAREIEASKRKSADLVAGLLRRMQEEQAR